MLTYNLSHKISYWFFRLLTTVSSSISTATGALGLKETNQFTAAWAKTGKFGREIYSDDYRTNIKKHPELDTGKWSNWETRYIPSSTLNISQYMDLYNDVIAIYSWHDGEVYGIQIFNQSLADFHKQLFDLTWNLAK